MPTNKEQKNPSTLHRHPLKHQPLPQTPKLRLPHIPPIRRPRPPRPPRPRPRQLPLPPLHIRTTQIQHRHHAHTPRVLAPRHRGRRALLPHQLQQPTDHLRRGVRAQRPGRLRVADHGGEVGHVLQHDALPEELLREVDFSAVDGDGRAAADLDFQARGGDDEVRGEEIARVHFYARGGDALDGAGDDVRRAGAQGLEELGVWVEAEALFPGVVARVEVRVVRDVLREALLGFFTDEVPGGVGEAPAEIDEELRQDEEFGADEAEDEPGGEEFRHPGGGGVDGGPREDVAWTALEHGYMGSFFRQNGNEGDRGGAAPNHDDFLGRVVVLLGPELRVDDRALEV